MTDSTQYEEELNLILSMIQHERIEVRKRAIDILALMTSPKPGEDHTSQCDFVVCALSSVPNMTKLIRCFTSSNQLLHGSLLTTLVNVTQKIEAVRIFLETQGISRVMQFFFGHLSTTAKSTVSTSILELVLMLLTNLTSLGGVEAARALLQIDTASDLRGFYLESLLNIALEENVSPTTVRWWLNVLTNITCEEFAKSTILSNREILCVLSRWIQECDQYELHAYYSLCVVRNCVLGSNEQHHEALMSCDSILHAVLNNLSEGRPKVSTEFLSAAVEFIYLLCTTKVGVQGMEAHNGKKALRAMLDTPSHVLHHEESSNALRMVQKLMNTLEDVQDVVVQTSEEENKPPVETISSETKKHSSNASQDKGSMEHLD